VVALNGWASIVDAAAGDSPVSAARTRGCSADALSASFAGRVARPARAMLYPSGVSDVPGAGGGAGVADGVADGDGDARRRPPVGVWHHSRAHRFFSQARWQPDQLGLRLLDVIVERLLDRDEALVLAVDDTLLHRLGRKVHATYWHHDATANSDQATVAWGNNWVVIGVNVKLAFMARTVCLPVLFRLWQPRRKHIPRGKPDPERPGKVELARKLADLIAAKYPDRIVHVVGDSGYASGAWRGLDAVRVTVTVRLRKDAALYEREPPKTGKRGRPALKGTRLRTLSEIALGPGTVWQQLTARRYGKHETIDVHVIDCLWHGALGYTPVRMIMIRDTIKPAGYQLALITTDLTSPAGEIIKRYDDRWPIEVRFEEAKHQAGVGHARNRTQRAVQRTVPFSVPHDDHHDPLIRTARPPPPRRPRAPRHRALVSDESQPELRRHARQAPPHDHRQPILTRSTPRPLPTENRSHPANMGSPNRLKPISRESGTKARLHYDRRRAQNACRQLEQTFGRREVEGRGRGPGRAWRENRRACCRSRSRPAVGVEAQSDAHPEGCSRRTLEWVTQTCGAGSPRRAGFREPPPRRGTARQRPICSRRRE